MHSFLPKAAPGTTATFSLSVRGGEPVAVSVEADDGNADIDDLVADINTALATAKLDEEVVALRLGGRIALATAAVGQDAALAISIESPDPGDEQRDAIRAAVDVLGQRSSARQDQPVGFQPFNCEDSVRAQRYFCQTRGTSRFVR